MDWRNQGAAAAKSRAVNIIFVSKVEMNPYVSLLAAAMEGADEGVHCIVVKDLAPRWLWQKRREINVLHLHWAELLYSSSARLLSAVRKWLRFVVSMVLLKLSGIRLAYTVHNIEQHEGRYPLLNRLANGLLFRFADVIHVHDRRTVDEVAGRFGRREGVFVIPHGNYLSYPNACTRAEARAKLGLAEPDFVYLTLGQIRPYKGIEELLQAFAQLSDDDVRLLIAGHVHERAYAERIEKLAAADGRVHLRLGYVPPEEIQYYMNACDICVLPYRHVTTSGAAILAFSFARPIIAPRSGDFPQLAGERRGVLYENTEDEQGRVQALLEALQRARWLDLATASAAAYALARELDWEVIARQHLSAYAQGRKPIPQRARA
jgi:beta-1,4-mannosyltransferase